MRLQTAFGFSLGWAVVAVIVMADSTFAQSQCPFSDPSVCVTIVDPSNPPQPAASDEYRESEVDMAPLGADLGKIVGVAGSIFQSIPPHAPPNIIAFQAAQIPNMQWPYSVDLQTVSTNDAERALSVPAAPHFVKAIERAGGWVNISYLLSKRNFVTPFGSVTLHGFQILTQTGKTFFLAALMKNEHSVRIGYQNVYEVHP